MGPTTSYVCGASSLVMFSQAAHLSHHRPAQLEMHLLPVSQFEMAGVGVKIFLETRYGYAIGMQVVNAKSAAYVDMTHLDILLFQLGLQLVDAVAKRDEIPHVQYL